MLAIVVALLGLITISNKFVGGEILGTVSPLIPRIILKVYFPACNFDGARYIEVPCFLPDLAEGEIRQG